MHAPDETPPDAATDEDILNQRSAAEIDALIADGRLNELTWYDIQSLSPRQLKSLSDNFAQYYASHSGSSSALPDPDLALDNPDAFNMTVQQLKAFKSTQIPYMNPVLIRLMDRAQVKALTADDFDLMTNEQLTGLRTQSLMVSQLEMLSGRLQYLNFSNVYEYFWQNFPVDLIPELPASLFHEASRGGGGRLLLILGGDTNRLQQLTAEQLGALSTNGWKKILLGPFRVYEMTADQIPLIPHDVLTAGLMRLPGPMVAHLTRDQIHAIPDGVQFDFLKQLSTTYPTDFLNLSPQQILGAAPHAMSLLQASQLNKFNLAEIAELTPDQVKNITGSTWRDVSSDLLKALTTDQILQMQPWALQFLPSARVHLLQENDFARMTVWQLRGLLPDALSTSQLRMLNGGVLSQLNYAAAGEMFWTYLPDDLLPKVPPAVFATNDMSKLPEIVQTAARFRSLTPDQLHNLSPEGWGVLLNDFGGTILLKPEQIAKIPDSVLEDLLTHGHFEQLQLSVSQLNSVSLSVLKFYHDTFPDAFEKNFAPAAILGLQPAAMALVSVAKLNAFTDAQIALLSSAQISYITVWGQVDHRVIAALTATQIGGMDVPTLASLPQSQLSLTQIRAIAPLSIGGLYTLAGYQACNVSTDLPGAWQYDRFYRQENATALASSDQFVVADGPLELMTQTWSQYNHYNYSTSKTGAIDNVTITYLGNELPIETDFIAFDGSGRLSYANISTLPVAADQSVYTGHTLTYTYGTGSQSQRLLSVTDVDWRNRTAGTKTTTLQYDSNGRLTGTQTSFTSNGSLLERTDKFVYDKDGILVAKEEYLPPGLVVPGTNAQFANIEFDKSSASLSAIQLAQVLAAHADRPGGIVSQTQVVHVDLTPPLLAYTAP